MEGVFLSGEGMFELEGMSEVLQGAILEGFDQRNVEANRPFLLARLFSGIAIYHSGSFLKDYCPFSLTPVFAFLRFCSA